MRVIQAQSAGFCYGVERAVRMAEEAAAAGGCVMLGSIIHNDSVVRRLEALGAKYAEYDEAALEVPAEQIGTLVGKGGEHARELQERFGVEIQTRAKDVKLWGPAGALEAAITALAIQEGFVPPTINYDEPDLDVDTAKGETPLDLNYTPNKGVARDIRVALSTSLGFGGHNGGHNGVLVLKKA